MQSLHVTIAWTFRHLTLPVSAVLVFSFSLSLLDILQGCATCTCKGHDAVRGKEDSGHTSERVCQVASRRPGHRGAPAKQTLFSRKGCGRRWPGWPLVDPLLRWPFWWPRLQHPDDSSSASVIWSQCVDIPLVPACMPSDSRTMLFAIKLQPRPRLSFGHASICHKGDGSPLARRPLQP